MTLEVLIKNIMIKCPMVDDTVTLLPDNGFYVMKAITWKPLTLLSPSQIVTF
jgi:hypothetical protein